MTDPAPEPHAGTDAEPAAGTPADSPSAQSPQPRRSLFRRRRPAAGASDAVADAPAKAEDGAAGAETTGRIRPGVLRRRRRRLMGAYEQGIFDLGGLAMELHRRGLLAEDVMRRRAAEVADIRGQLDDVSARLDEIRAERQERRQAGRGPSLACPSCGTRSRATANFCAACGASLTPGTAEGAATAEGDDQPTTVIAGDDQPTTVIETDDPEHTAVIPPPPGDHA